MEVLVMPHRKGGAMTPQHDMGIEAVKVAPAAAVSGAGIMGIPISEWITILTLIYVVGLVIHQIPKHLDGIRALRLRYGLWRELRKDRKRGRK